MAAPASSRVASWRCAAAFASADDKWSLQGHGGLSAIPQDPGATTRFPRVYEDWSLTLGREVRSFNIGLGVASSNYPVIGASGHARISATIGRAF